MVDPPFDVRALHTITSLISEEADEPIPLAKGNDPSARTQSVETRISSHASPRMELHRASLRLRTRFVPDGQCTTPPFAFTTHLTPRNGPTQTSMPPSRAFGLSLWGGLAGTPARYDRRNRRFYTNNEEVFIEMLYWSTEYVSTSIGVVCKEAALCATLSARSSSISSKTQAL